MSKRNLLLDATPQERVIVSATTLFFPVILRLPDTLKETMPAAQSRAIEKLHLMRFTTSPLGTISSNSRRTYGAF